MNLPFSENTFHLVTAFETIYFWPGIQVAFQQVLGGGGCGDGAVFQEARLQPGQRLRSGAGADALVPADHHLAAVGAGDGLSLIHISSGTA